MATTKTIRRWGAVLLTTVLTPVALIAACSNSNDNPVPPVTYTLPEAGADTSTSTTDSGTPSNGNDSSSTQTDSSTGNTDAPVDAPLTTKDGALVQDAATCVGDGGCWGCTPISTPDFLNQCTSSQCLPFSNSILPGYDGSLPPLN
jgi:hypothetical protein